MRSHCCTSLLMCVSFFLPLAATVYGQTDGDAIPDVHRYCVCFADTFDGAENSSRGKQVDGLSGKALATTGNLRYETAQTISRGAGTIGFWSRMEFDVEQGSFILSFDDGGGLYVNFFGKKGAGDPRHVELGRLWSNIGGGFASFPGAVKAGTWNHYALTWNADMVCFYWNGKLSSKFIAPVSISSGIPMKSFTLGNPWPDPKNPREYLFDELRVYNRALSQPELEAYVAAVKAGGEKLKTAMELPKVMASRKTLGLRSTYRVSDHAIQIYGDLQSLNGAARNQPPQKFPANVSVKNSAGKEIANIAVQDCSATSLLHCSIPMQNPLPDGDYFVTIKTGDVSATASFNRLKEPWEGNRLGVTDQPVAPWPPMTLPDKGIFSSGAKAACWGRVYTFGNLGLPEKILSTQPEPCWGEATKELLAAPVALGVETDTGTLGWKDSTPSLSLRSPTYVDIEAESETTDGSLKASAKGTLEFDGFYKFNLTITPSKELSVSSVRLEVPLPNEIAKLFNMSSIGDMRTNKAFLDLAGKPDGELWNSFNGGTNKGFNFCPHVWFGDDDRGIAFMGDNNRGWIVDNSKPCMDLVRKNGQTVLRFLLVNTPAVLKDPITTTLSLQATPIRPRAPGGSWKKEKAYGWSYFDAPILFPNCFEPEKCKRAEDHPGFVDEEAKKANRWWRYFCFRSDRIEPTDTANYPTILRNEDEWTGDWGPGLHVPSQNDYLLWVYKLWHDKLGMAGIYYDNTFANVAGTLGTGLAWQDKDGGIRQSSCMFGDREFLKRVRAYFLEQGPAPILNVHMTDAPIIGSLGFSDFWLDGENGGYLTKEQVDREAKGEKFDFVDRWLNDKGIPNLRITMGRMWGVMPTYLYTWGLEETQTVLGLFDIPHGKRITLGTAPRNDIDLTAPDLRFHGFWNPDGRWQVVKGGDRIFVSAWSRPEPLRVRLMISNGNDGPAEVDLKIDLAKFGFSGPVEASDEVDGAILPMEKGLIKGIQIRRHMNRCLLLAAPGVFKTGPPEDIAVLNTGKRIPELCDDFTALKPEWEKSFNPTPSYGPKTNSPTFEPYYGTIRIHTNGGYANISRPFSRDGVSVRVRAYPPTGQQCGNPTETHPMSALYWGKNRYIKCVLTNPWGNAAGDRTEMFFVVCKDGAMQTIPCPKPGPSDWVRWDLMPESIALFACTDGKDWKKIADVPRGAEAGKSFAGVPSHIVLGTGCDNGPADRLRNDTPGIDDSWSCFDELIVEEISK